MVRRPLLVLALALTHVGGAARAHAEPEQPATPATLTPAPGAVATKPRPVTRPKLQFVAGERMTWRLTVRGILAGHVTVAVGEPGTLDGRKTVILVAGVEPEGLFRLVSDASGTATATLDVAAGIPVMHRLETKGGWVESHLGTTAFDVVVKEAGKPPQAIRQEMPAGEAAFDVPVALLAVRSLRKGGKLAMSVIADTRIWRASLTVSARETLSTPLGKMPALRLAGDSWRLDRHHEVDPARKPQAFQMWVSDDAYHLPLRVSATMPYGELRLELVEYAGADVVLRAD